MTKQLNTEHQSITSWAVRLKYGDKLVEPETFSAEWKNVELEHRQTEIKVTTLRAEHWDYSELVFRYFIVFLKEESDTNTDTEAAVSTWLRRPDSQTIQTRLSLNSPEHELRDKHQS